MHDAAYLKDHPDAAPVGHRRPSRARRPTAGRASARPIRATAGLGWRRSARTLADFAIDGIWLDYHHAHASWEQAEPNLPDTCFCDRCLARFARETGVDLPDRPTPELARSLLGPHKDGLGQLAVRRVHRLGPRVPRHPRRRSAPLPAGDVPLPLVGGRARRRAARRSWRST